MKICSDCRHCDDAGKNSVCNAPGNLGVDRVTGKRARRYSFCSTHRTGEGWLMSVLLRTCGERGRWFQAKESE